MNPPTRPGTNRPGTRAPQRRAARAVRQLGQAALRVAALRVLVDRITAEHTQARDELAALLRTAHAGFRVKSVDVELPGVDTPVATATLTGPAETTQVTDPAAHLAWVAEHYPDQVIQMVEPGFARQLLGELTLDPGTGALVHSPTGQPITWAHRVSSGLPYPTLRFTATGRETVLTAWHAGHLDILTPGAATTAADPATEPAPSTNRASGTRTVPPSNPTVETTP